MVGSNKCRRKDPYKRPFSRSKKRPLPPVAAQKQKSGSKGENPQGSTSARKLRTSDEFVPVLVTRFLYVIIEFFGVFDELAELVKCKKCGGDVTFDMNNCKGLGFNIAMTCSTVGCNVQLISSCPVVQYSYEVNTRIQFAMRLLGVAHAGLKLFCGIMCMKPPIVKSAFQLLNKKIHNACEALAECVMNKAAREERDASQTSHAFEDPEGVSVSVDGSWMKRGFTSLFGIVVIIGQLTGKVCDITVKSAYCKVCEIWEKKDHGSQEYRDYVDDHWPYCNANHDGSSGSMEVKGAVQLFERSVDRRDVKYLNFIGDGDSKTHKAVVEADPYGPDAPVVKKECVGHVGKRMGTRLRNIQKEKKLGGRGRLTGKEIDKLSSYYGNAIRQNPDSAEDMKNAIWATWHHRASTDRKPQHQLCPKGEESWCEWQRAKARGDNMKKFKHALGMPSDVMEAIKPVYVALTNMDLLERCVGAHTQNANESFNSTVWRMAPKAKFAGSVVVETASLIAVSLFNEGHNSLLSIMKELGLTVGEQSATECRERDAERIQHANRKTAAATKEVRIELRRARLAAQDKALDEEGVLYGPGID